MTLLDGILERNDEFVRQRTSRPLPAPEAIRLAVVACYDPRLDALLPEALGIEAGGAFLLRTAGALLQAGGSALRSLAMAVYLFEVREVLVVGHTSCRMAAFDTAGFIDAFRRRGVLREAFGTGDLRAWAGAIPDARSGVRTSVANLRGAPFLPRDLVVSGVVLDDASGALEVVARPEEALEPASEPLPGPEPDEAAPEAPAHPPPPVAPAPAGEDAPLARVIEGVARALESRTALGAAAKGLRKDLDAEPSLLAKLRVLDRHLRAAGPRASELVQILDAVRRQAVASRGRLDSAQVRQLLDHLGGDLRR